MMFKKYGLLILIILLNFYSFSQQYFFRNFSIDQGLPQSSVYCMLQDTRGYIWMGTDGGGVCKYDGRNVEVINKNSGLTGNIVRSLFEDSKGNIWIGTDNGITIFNGLSFKKITSKDNFQGSFALKIFESKNGLIWVATNDAGLYKIELNDSIKLTNYSVSDGLVNNFIFDIYEDSQSRIWLAMLGGINILEFTNESFNVTKLIQDRDLPSGFIISIEPNKSGELLFGTYGNGAFKITNPLSNEGFKIIKFANNIVPTQATIWDIHSRANGETWIATDDQGVIKIDKENKTQHFYNENAFETNQILDIIEDREGNLWFSTMGKGVYMHSNDKFLSYQKKYGIPDNNITSLLSSKNKLFVGTNEGFAEFTIKDKSLNLVKTLNTNKGLSDNRINTIIKSYDNKLWLGTNEGINIIDGRKIKILKTEDGLNSNKINCLFKDNIGHIWIGTDDGYNKIVDGEIYSFTQDEGFINSEVQTIIQDKEGKIWMGTLRGLASLEDSIYTDYNEIEGLTALRIHCLSEDKNGDIWIGTFGGGLFKFDQSKDSMPISLIADKQVLSSNNIYSLIFTNDTSLIVGTDKGFDYLFLDRNLTLQKTIHYNTNDGFTGGENNLNAITKDSNNNIWFGTIGGLIKFTTDEISENNKLPQTYIVNLKLFFEDVNWDSGKFQRNKWFNTPKDLELSYNENHLTFDFSGIYFEDPNDIGFSYFLEGQSKSWSPFTKNTEVIFPALSHGDYTFKVRCKNKYNLVSPVDELNFYIKPPFYKTWWFILSVSLIFILIIIAYIRYRESQLKKDKIKLERIVHERTLEVVKQKDKIEKQRDIVTNQKKEITDSINYAQNIQRAVLPKEDILTESFSDHFILFRPKDIVSGDFYWMSKKNNHIIFTAADCTGHGVPGAFMSMLGVSFLNKIVNEKGVTQPDLILNELRENIISSLQQKGLSEESKDGMDISICSFDIDKRKLFFAGANNPLIHITKVESDYELNEVKGDRMPVAIYRKMNNFVYHEIDYKKGDTIYLFSDGYIDQFGGPDGRKFMKKRFKELLLESQGKTMMEQKELYNSIIDDWINYESPGNSIHQQIDDIIVMGVKI